MRRFFLLIINLTLFYAVVWAQFSVPNPIRWTERVEMTSQTEGIVTLTANITKGWHLYGTEIPSGGPVATSFDFIVSPGIKFVGDMTSDSEPEQNHDDNFDMELTWWNSSVSFQRRFLIEDKSDEMQIEVKIRYMACNDRNCSPPKTVTLTEIVKPAEN